MKQLDFETIKKSVIAKKYTWFTDKPMIVGIRTTTSLPDVFNDYIVLCQESKDKYFKGWMATTEPGVYWLNKPMNVKGTGILVPNQYYNCWGFGKHGSGLNNHKALVQIRPITLYRDSNKDSKVDLDPKKLDTGLFGVNIHSTGKSNWIAPRIDKWSAGCQVFPNYDGFKEFISQLEKSNQTSFTYTLLEEKDII
jgi:hypothetical protein